MSRLTKVSLPYDTILHANELLGKCTCVNCLTSYNISCRNFRCRVCGKMLARSYILHDISHIILLIVLIVMISLSNLVSSRLLTHTYRRSSYYQKLDKSAHDIFINNMFIFLNRQIIDEYIKNPSDISMFREMQVNTLNRLYVDYLPNKNKYYKLHKVFKVVIFDY